MDNQLDNKGLDDSVAQTLFIPLYMKSQQSRRKDAFFSDPVACTLIDKLDYDFSFFKNSQRSAIGCAIRARFFDAKVVEFVARHDNTVIVNLGCGLDARYQRVKDRLKYTPPFYHLDLPEVITLREQYISPVSEDIAIKGSLFDSEWMDTLQQTHPDARFMFTIEGVLLYFDKTEVQRVITELATRFSGCEILFDASNQWMCKNSHRHDTLKHTGARFKLALDDPMEIEQWCEKLKVVNTTYYNDFEEWKQAGLFTYYLMKISRTLKTSSYIVHCRALA
ncbi:class I SAM-dependent methyltransferase [Thaumasiovibrio subtropicus]|uniref:class I SAM-dependent methyltransferase n=1 Tax=Thaumasiovibrio subtropicus TaxID=1891207 RepID=UPI000B358515|nr:class I SAM-dependent methyltransferase [Thaumasiovibrio subtropicus]